MAFKIPTTTILSEKQRSKQTLRLASFTPFCLFSNQQQKTKQANKNTHIEGLILQCLLSL